MPRIGKKVESEENSKFETANRTSFRVILFRGETLAGNADVALVTHPSSRSTRLPSSFCVENVSREEKGRGELSQLGGKNLQEMDCESRGPCVTFVLDLITDPFFDEEATKSKNLLNPI